MARRLGIVPEETNISEVNFGKTTSIKFYKKIEILNNGDLIKVNLKKNCDDATKNSTEEGHVINMDIEEDDAEDHRQMSPEAATSPSPSALQPDEVNNKEEDKHLRKIVHSKSLDDLDDLKTSEDAAAASATVNDTVKTASTAEEETATTLDNAGEKKGM